VRDDRHANWGSGSRLIGVSVGRGVLRSRLPNGRTPIQSSSSTVSPQRRFTGTRCAQT